MTGRRKGSYVKGGLITERHRRDNQPQGCSEKPYGNLLFINVKCMPFFHIKKHKFHENHSKQGMTLLPAATDSNIKGPVQSVGYFRQSAWSRVSRRSPK